MRRLLVWGGLAAAIAATVADRGQSVILAVIAIAGLLSVGLGIAWPRLRPRRVVASAGLDSARVLAGRLASGAGIDPLKVWGLVLQPGETAYLDAVLNVAWACPSWGPEQLCDAVVTDRRVSLPTSDVWWDRVTRLWPDPSALTLDLIDGPSLRLTGRDAAVVSVFATWVVHGPDGLAGHPALAALRP